MPRRGPEGLNEIPLEELVVQAGENMHRSTSKKVVSVTKEKLSRELKREKDQCPRLNRRAFQGKGTVKTKVWG